jgi:hypothetical protein
MRRLIVTGEHCKQRALRERRERGYKLNRLHTSGFCVLCERNAASQQCHSRSPSEQFPITLFHSLSSRRREAFDAADGYNLEVACLRQKGMALGRNVSMLFFRTSPALFAKLACCLVRPV